ncbi:efflux RND transporter periplasmic adaptor subunit [Jiella sp. M17.18]|uniref:efflux RND transporter periplasmic adaptor subunit n=1 Tax=Jiella sp. M17.18 TaxID=3234247 RepID=UPI0034DE01F6
MRDDVVGRRLLSRAAACFCVLCLLAGPGQAQQQSGGGGSTGQTAADGQAQGDSQSGGGGSGQGEGGATLDLPLIGKIELPGFLSFLGSRDGGSGSGGKGGAAAQAADQPPPAVITETATVKPVGDRFEFIGRIAPIQKVAIQARVAGYLEKVAFKGGQTVHKGDLLFQIETDQYQAALAAAKAQLSGAQAQLNEAQRSLARNKQLAQSGTVAQANLDQAQAQFESAQATRLQAEAAVQQAQLNLGYTKIVAPIDGEISAPLITVGNYVTASSGTLANLIQMDPIWGVFPIGEGQLINWKKLGVGRSGSSAAVNQAGGNSGGSGDQAGGSGAQNDGGGASAAGGSAAQGPAGPPPGAAEVGGAGDSGSSNGKDAEDFVLSLVLPNGSKYRPNGTFDFVDNTVSATTGTIETRISFPNPGGYLLPNENVTLVATQKDPPRLPVIPQAAVQLSRKGRSVLIVKADDTIARRMITVAGGSSGTLDPGEVAVTSGLKGGEDVVVRGAMTLKEGQKVSPRPASAAAGHGAGGPAAGSADAGAGAGQGGGEGGAPGGATGAGDTMGAGGGRTDRGGSAG